MAASRAGSGDNPFAPVVQLKGRILQVRNVARRRDRRLWRDQDAERDRSRIAIVSVGYADGFFRSLSAKDGEAGLAVYLGSHAAPILGRVSMDLITIDVTDVPEEHLEPRRVGRADRAERPGARHRRATPAPSTTRSSPISAGAPSGAMSAASASPWPKLREPSSAKPAAR